MEKAGMLQWFQFHDYERVERAIVDLQMLGITELRTGFSWADWCRPDGPQWFAWLIPKLAEHFHILPCFTYAPPSYTRKRKINSPPRRLERYAQFLDQVLRIYGDYFEYVELWNEPNNDSEWNSKEDPRYELFAAMVGRAAQVAHAHGKITVLGGMSPPASPDWLRVVADHGLLEHIDIVGIHAFPGTGDWDNHWTSWEDRIMTLANFLQERNCPAKIWVTETGFSTLGGQEIQIRMFQDALSAPVERVYWYSLYDLPRERRTVRGATTGYDDKHEYHMGIKDAAGMPKLLFREWQAMVVPKTI